MTTPTNNTFSELFVWEWGGAMDTTDFELAKDWLEFSSAHLQFSTVADSIE